MSRLFWLIALCGVAVSCQRETGQVRPQAATSPPKTNVISKVDEKGRLTESLVYATNGLLKQHTFVETAEDGRVIGARTVDAEGRPKWTEKYLYAEAGGTRPIEIRRYKPNGKTIAMHFRYAPDGTPKRIVFAPDGREITTPEQKVLLEE